MTAPLDIAIVGMGGCFPGSPTLDQFWELICERRDQVAPIPVERWVMPPEMAIAPDTFDRATNRHACLINQIPFDPTDWSSLGPDAKLLDPAQQLVLSAARQALANCQELELRRPRCGVILAAIALPTDGSCELTRHLHLHQAEDGQGDRSPDSIFNHLTAARVTAVPAALTARALELGGLTYTLDAACASSLYAIKLACDQLRQGRTDMMLAGGLSRPDCLFTQIGFSQLRALSRNGRCAPFDRSADGLVVGEGAGILVLKRLGDAVDDGDEILAVIKGIGLTNDRQGSLLAPQAEGQVRAMTQAYAMAGWQPHQVQLIECHGSGTPLGDAIELESLAALWETLTIEPPSAAPQCALGSVKSNVGHLLTAAGAAGMIKVLLALKHKTLPPSANFDQAADDSPLHNSPFYVPTDCAPWSPQAPDAPRRAAVSGFGFGGINAHLLLEEWQAPRQTPEDPRRVEVQSAPSGNTSPAIAIVGMAVTIGQNHHLEDLRRAIFDGRSLTGERPADRWRGLEQHQDLQRLIDPALQGAWMDGLTLDASRFAIPPKEIPDILPQQLLMLSVAAQALEDAGPERPSTAQTTGAIVGIEFDYQASDFHLRWHLQGHHQAGPDLDRWCPPLTPVRTVGALGNIVASRIAKCFKLGGPCFAVSAGALSGIQALDIGFSALQQGQLDRVLVGAVDLGGDLRNLLIRNAHCRFSATGRVRPFDASADGTLPGEGAVALVLKRLTDVNPDQEKVYAILESVGQATHPDMGTGLTRALEACFATHEDRTRERIKTIGYIETHGSGDPHTDDLEARALDRFFSPFMAPQSHQAAVGSVKSVCGHLGCAAGLLGILKSALCLFHHQIAPLPHYRQPRQEVWQQQRFYLPQEAHYWTHDRQTGPRRACVTALSLDCQAAAVVLRQAPSPQTAAAVRLPPAQPALPHGLMVVGANAPTDLPDRLADLEGWTAAHNHLNAHDLAAGWYAHQPQALKAAQRVTLVFENAAQLARTIRSATTALKGTPFRTPVSGAQWYYDPEPLGKTTSPKPGLVFVYPGSGNHFLGMGRDIGRYWPQVLEAMDCGTATLRAQMVPEVYTPYRVDWSPGWATEAARDLDQDPLHAIFGQVMFAQTMTGLLECFDIRPRAVMGYSLGESAAFFATGTWTAPQKMLGRMQHTDLFSYQLAGPCLAARKTWQLTPAAPFEWRVVAVNRPAQAVRDQLARFSLVRLLIVNTPDECVIGGHAPQVNALIEALSAQGVLLNGVVTVHCDAVTPVAEAYAKLHHFDTEPPSDVQFYRCVDGQAYQPTADTAAQAILDQARYGFDWPANVAQVYEEGWRVFVEIGPQGSCSRMIDRILGDRPHLALAASHKGQPEHLSVLHLLARLISAHLPVNLKSLYGAPQANAAKISGTALPVPRPRLPRLKKSSTKTLQAPLQATQPEPHVSSSARSVPLPGPGNSQDAPLPPKFSELLRQWQATTEATQHAHQTFLEFSAEMTRSMASAFKTQNQLLRAATQASAELDAPTNRAPTPPEAPADFVFPPADPARFDRDQCLEFAVGSAQRVLGPAFADLDTFAVRVRLPDEPLMLVDRILTVEGSPGELGPGRVVTEHDVHPQAWYLDGDRAPVCISVEAGQADLFLCSYLGIDLALRGERSYRLLDAKVQFYRGLPRPGERIRYDIHIDKFVQQGQTYLFFFRFEGSIDGQPLITMTDGCAGFFTAQESLHSGGILDNEVGPTEIPQQPGTPLEPFVPWQSTHIDAAGLEALRRGDLAACFGPAFGDRACAPSLWLPGGRMHLIDRVLSIEPRGGVYGCGRIRAEADINPRAWYLTCHFVDDRVMPGTLMYECCAHALRVFVMGIGWISDNPRAAFEVLPGISSALKCRGPVTPATQRVVYEVDIKAMGANPQPYVIADANMYADGKRIVRFVDMGLQLSGITTGKLRDQWQSAPAPALFDRRRIEAFAVGRPSEAFGAPYEVFDETRKIARLPGPPYMFMDAVTRIDHPAWQLQPGGWIEAAYTTHQDNWYYTANRCGSMPFCVLLEIALQPCGWLAAYAGSALRSQTDLRFRNLGGNAVQYHNLPDGTTDLRMRTRLTKVSEAADMIIEHFDFQVLAGETLIYDGTTYFGFFSPTALSDQKGLQPAPAIEKGRGAIQGPLALPKTAPRTPIDAVRPGPPRADLPAQALLMVDSIEEFRPQGGPQGLGYIRGLKTVDVDEWFFKAHFYQDPVCPGSLGVESFLQLIKYAALQRWPDAVDTHAFEMVTDVQHQWTYRGQIIPADRQIHIEAVITAVEEKPRPVLMAEGWVQVDGRYIYHLENFGIRLAPNEKAPTTQTLQDLSG